MEMFNAIDDDGGGSLDLTELNALTQDMGLSLNAMELNSAMEEMDKDFDGEVIFCGCLNQNPMSHTVPFAGELSRIF